MIYGQINLIYNRAPWALLGWHCGFLAHDIARGVLPLGAPLKVELRRLAWSTSHHTHPSICPDAEVTRLDSPMGNNCLSPNWRKPPQLTFTQATRSSPVANRQRPLIPMTPTASARVTSDGVARVPVCARPGPPGHSGRGRVRSPSAARRCALAPVHSEGQERGGGRKKKEAKVSQEAPQTT